MWLSGCRTSVAEHWWLKSEVSWVWLLVAAGLFHFPLFITSNFLHLFIIHWTNSLIHTIFKLTISTKLFGSARVYYICSVQSSSSCNTYTKHAFLGGSKSNKPERRYITVTVLLRISITFIYCTALHAQTTYWIRCSTEICWAPNSVCGLSKWLISTYNAAISGSSAI